MTYRVVLEILADLGGIDNGIDAKRLKLRGVTDSGQHHDLRGANRARREDNLLGGIQSVDSSFWQTYQQMRGDVEKIFNYSLSADAANWTVANEGESAVESLLTNLRTWCCMRTSRFFRAYTSGVK